MFRPLKNSVLIKPLILCASLGVLAGCGAPDVSQGINDPHEQDNRKAHRLNKSLDTNIVRPVSTAYGTVVPNPVRAGVTNFSDNLSLPAIVLNDVLQLRLGDAVHNTGRFMVNTTFGLGGLLDPADEMGLTERDTDFGETLHVWGVGEGTYIELPVLGPSTERDTLGTLVDFVISPTRALLPSDLNTVKTASNIGDAANSRYQFTGTIDGILYDSVDSYAQARLLYLQNRRFELGQSSPTEDSYDDLYEDLYEQ